MWQRMSDEDYHRLPHLSSSLLRTFMRSEEKYLHQIQFPSSSTPAQVIGTASHLAVFQPDEFERIVVAAPKCDRRTKEGKATHAAFLESVKPNQIVLDQEDLTTCLRMAEKVRNSPYWNGLGVGDPSAQYELAAITNIEHDLKAKIKPDALLNWGLIDYKSTSTVEPRAFQQSIWRYGYAHQFAFYKHVIKHFEPERTLDRFFILAQEKTPPYCVRAFEISPAVIQAAHEEIYEAIERLFMAQSFNDWRTNDTIETVSLPAWYSPGFTKLFGTVTSEDE